MREILIIAVERLRKNYQDLQLTAFECWHEHDAYISPCRQTTWQELDKNLSSNDALYQSRNGDDFVHRAFYDPKGEFLLRYDVPDDDLYLETHGTVGTFDLAAPVASLEEILASCPERLTANLGLENAERYFNEAYAG